MYKSVRITHYNKILYERYILKKNLKGTNCTKGYVLGILFEESIIKNVSNKDIIRSYNSLQNIQDKESCFITTPTTLNLKMDTILSLDAWYSRCRTIIPNVDMSLSIDIAYDIAIISNDVKPWAPKENEISFQKKANTDLWWLAEKIIHLCKKANAGDKEAYELLCDIQKLVVNK